MNFSDGTSQAGRPQELHEDYPVHLTDLIQPHGVLLALEWPTLRVLRVSENSLQHLGRSPQALLGTPFSELLSAAATRQLQRTVGVLESQVSENQDRNERPTYLRLPVTTQKNECWFDCFLSRDGSYLVLEMEPVAGIDDSNTAIAVQEKVATAIARLSQIKDINAFLQAAAAEVQALTGYDRIMVYQFDETAAGSVIAEVKQPDQVSYLGLHYPAADIPRLVRGFYQAGMTRFVADVSAKSIDILLDDSDHRSDSLQPETLQPDTLKRTISGTDISDAEGNGLGSNDVEGAHTSDSPNNSPATVGHPSENPEGNRPLDLRQAVLRGVDPCCQEYHQNMGVAAFLVLSLVKDNKLWGLISCHHASPKHLSHRVRSGCEILTQFVAAALSGKVNEDEVDYLKQLKSIQSDFITSISEAEDFKQALIHPQPRLLELAGATGAAVCLDKDLTLVGDTPSKADVQALIDWSLAESDDTIFQTDRLSEVYPAAIAYKEVASGILILKISQLRRYLILWFRPEVLQTVSWAGDPNEAIQKAEDGTVLLCPRNSFSQWQETVQATSKPWKIAEIESAYDLRNAIIGIVLNKADELAQINLELERSNKELDSFAYAASHDLKEPLRGITNFSNILLRRHGQSMDEKGVERLHTLVRLAKRMDTLIDALLRFSRLGQTELRYKPTNLNKLVKKAIDDLLISREDQAAQAHIEVVRTLPTVNCDPILLREVFNNLIGNALKYTEKPESIIKIGYWEPEEQSVNIPESPLAKLNPKGPIFYIQDNGIGIHKRHHTNIFRLFKRLHERESYGGGNGVGLTITHKIIERHKGHIWVASELGQGTTFYFGLNYDES